jgi:hypothetical protein
MPLWTYARAEPCLDINQKFLRISTGTNLASTIIIGEMPENSAESIGSHKPHRQPDGLM